MIVLGIDPGSLCTGYGVVRLESGRLSALACGVVRPPAKRSHAERIGAIFGELDGVIAEFSPGRIALETAFVNRNAQSALKLGQVRGAVLALAGSRGVPLEEYAPSEVKRAVAGSGSASKERIALMVASRLGLAEAPKPFDATDALAIALCDLQRGGAGTPSPSGKSGRRGSQSWSAFVNASPERVLGRL